ncbi:D-glucuronyl C5-epimerase B-like [Strongylocentrotus purpuratus]|uniref:heparosan-N-sulfate-glucuronate 5-epimerase n=1 Tax=Strongylocentrotus purpuratus TaxID=7668 RepID=A0A7M7NYZ2_STRPU|nr:D-glucuronyl C5-epimerase B-like [Strongylocentrotus purpuratus]
MTTTRRRENHQDGSLTAMKLRKEKQSYDFDATTEQNLVDFFELTSSIFFCCFLFSGVPLSTQWGQQGYFYPIQVAQFGLSHYSKNLTERPPRVTMYEDVEGHDLSSWSNPSPNGEIKIVTSEELDSHVIEFKTTGDTSPSSSSVWSHSLDTKSDFVIAFDLKLLGNASITIVAESEEQGRIISLVYTTDDDGFVIGNRKVTYGLGPVTQWRRITRALQIDYRKAMASLSTLKYKLTRKFILQRLLRIELRGHGFIDNIEIGTSLHMYHFYDAADWLVHHQDERGGWPIMVERILDDKMSLSPGWYSSMAQGQAMSVLTRAYIKSRRKKYIKAALHAARLFQIPSAQGGVLARFMDKYTWYEEYPTSPGSFVLNGFIYSMIGLYDVLSVADVEESRESRRLYDEGMVSLKAMLLLFDMGTGTLYDLRHLALGKAPNVARWDYHATHISQLQLLASIDPDPIFKETVARWIGYTKGKRARHN